MDSPEDNAHAQVAGRPGMPAAGMPQQPYGMTHEQAMQYQSYLQQQQQAAGSYPMPPQGRMPGHPQHQ